MGVPHIINAQGEIALRSDHLDMAVIETKSGLLTYSLFDKRNHMWINGEQLLRYRSLPQTESVLSMSCKLRVISSQMYKVNKRPNYAEQTTYETA